MSLLSVYVVCFWFISALVCVSLCSASSKRYVYYVSLKIVFAVVQCKGTFKIGDTDLSVCWCGCN